MSRSLFGAWGAGLPQEHFARALAAVAALGLRKDSLAEPAIVDSVWSMRSARRDIAVLRIEYLAQLIDALQRKSTGLRPAEEFLAAWDCFAHSWYDLQELPPNAHCLRLEIDPTVAGKLRHSLPELHWLIKLLLGSGDTLVSSAYLRVDEPDRPLAWECPMRVGLPGDARSRELAEQLAALRWPELLRLVDLDVADEDCDLLLLPDDLRCGLARVLQWPQRLRAGCVLLIGGAGLAAERILPLAAAMRSEVLTAGVGIVGIDPDRQGEWFQRLIEQLAHDLPLDVALVRAVQAVQTGPEDGEPPLFMASRRLADHARVEAFAQRFSFSRAAASEPAANPTGSAA